MNTMTMRNLVLGAIAATALALPVQAQDTDSRWLPFVGCWEAVGGEDEMGILCFNLENDGVALTNFVSGEAVSTEFLAADGQQRDVSAEGCSGWEALHFSEDRRRVFTRTEFLCGADEPRKGSGVMAFIGLNLWSDVRTLDVDGEPFSWIQDYRLAGVDLLAEEGIEDPAESVGMAVRAARMAAAAGLDFVDVVEATQNIDPKAVESWLVGQQVDFDPTGQDLIALADAGVPANVIDAVVAVSNPDRFMVASNGEIDGSAPAPTHYRGYMAFNPFWGPAWGLSMSNRYGYGQGYGYRPSLGYGYRGYGYGYWGSNPGVITIAPRPAGGTLQKGRGYTRGSGNGARSAQPRSAGGQPSYSTGGGDSSGSAGSSGSSGRTAKPRKARRRSGGSDGGTLLARSISSTVGNSGSKPATTRTRANPIARSSERPAATRSATRPTSTRSAPRSESSGSRARPSAQRSTSPPNSGSARRPSSGVRSAPAREAARRRGGR